MDDLPLSPRGDGPLDPERHCPRLPRHRPLQEDPGVARHAPGVAPDRAPDPLGPGPVGAGPDGVWSLARAPPLSLMFRTFAVAKAAPKRRALSPTETVAAALEPRFRKRFLA